MNKDNTKPNRKHPRLKEYDYSSAGAYFITICTQNKQQLLSHISTVCPENNITTVGWEHPPNNDSRHSDNTLTAVGRGLAPALKNKPVARNCIIGENLVRLELTPLGKIAEKQLLLLEERFPNLKINQYVIMPDHIHILLTLIPLSAGASPRPTIPDIICAYKSLTTKECKEVSSIKKLFQSSYYDHIIRGKDDFDEARKYICENPLRSYYKK